MNASRVSPHSLQHHFLVASPWLADPRFHGTVVYLCEHSDEGALGLVVNRPLDLILGEILEQMDLPGEDLDVPVYGGGPVQPERGFVLHTPGVVWQHTASVHADVSLTTSRDVLAAIGRCDGPARYQVLLGYSGWSAGQLEEELGSNAWLTCPAFADLLFETPVDQRYQAVLASMGIDLNQLTESVGHA